MNLATTKLELAKRLLATDDKDIIKNIKAILDAHEQNWFEELPTEIQSSVKKGLDDSQKGKVTPHAEVRKKYQKWLKK